MNSNSKRPLNRFFYAWLAIAALFVAAPAGAVVIVGGDNGWEVSFDGNVNGFYVYEDADAQPTSPVANGTRTVTTVGDVTTVVDSPCVVPEGSTSEATCNIRIPEGQVKLGGGAITSGAESSRVRTGLLPAFFSFNVRSPEVAGLRGSARISFAPQIQNANTKNNFGNGTQAGAQIDLREVFFNIDGSFGTLSVGRTLSLFQRHNILTDMTLFGVGVNGGHGAAGGGTTLGRIGYGYVYPQFNARISYKTQNVGGFQMEVGAYDPSRICHTANTVGGATKVCADGTKKPRFETEITYGTDYDAGSLLGWFGAMWQDAEDFNGAGGPDVTAWGISGGLQLSYSGFTLTGSGYRGDALGSVLMLDTDSLDSTGTERDNYGWIAQLTYSLNNLKLGVSYGENNSDLTGNEELRLSATALCPTGTTYTPASPCNGDTIAQEDRTLPIDKLSAFTFGAYYDVTPWFKLVGEYSRVENEWHNAVPFDPEQQSDVFSFGAFFTW